MCNWQLTALHPVPTQSNFQLRPCPARALTQHTQDRQAEDGSLQSSYKSLQSVSHPDPKANHPLRVITLERKVRPCATCRPPPAVRTTSDQRPVRWLVLGYRSTAPSSSLPLSFPLPPSLPLTTPPLRRDSSPGCCCSLFSHFTLPPRPQEPLDATLPN